MYKSHLVSVTKDKKKKAKQSVHKSVRKKGLKPILTKNRQPRNPFILEEKKVMAQKVFEPFDVASKQRDGISNTIITKEMESALRNHFHKMSKTKQTGGSFFKRALQGIHSIVNRIKTTFTGRDTLPPEARKVVEQHGNEKIVHIEVHREPIHQ